MSGRTLAVAVALTLAAQPALADKAKERERTSPSSPSKPAAAPRQSSRPSQAPAASSRRSGSSSPARARHRSSSPSRQSATSSRRSSSSKPARAQHQTRGSSSPPRAVPRGGGQSSPRLTDAQRRHPRAGTGRLYRSPSSYGYRSGSRYYGYGSYGYPYYGYGSYGSPYYSYGYPYYGYYGSGYYSGGYYGSYPSSYGYASSRHRRTGSLRIMVDPEDTNVYVDGYYAGIVDDFDGIFQRLRISTGRHVVTLKLEGFRTQRFRVYVLLDHTAKIHHDMVRGTGEDVAFVGDPEEWEDPPADRNPSRWEDEDRRASRWEGGQRGRSRESEERPQDTGAVDVGTLRMEVRPQDASVYVDGEFRGTGRNVRRLDLSPGSHRIEVVRPGFRTFERSVEIRPGRSLDLDVELERS